MSLNSSYSIVIASLGDDNISHTLNCIYESSIIPNEVILSLPPNKNINEKLELKNYVKVINSEKKGQVNQRIYGFKSAVSDYVLQLDDDVLFGKDMIKDLLEFLIRDQNICCAPFFLKKNSNLSFYNNSSFKNLIYNFSLKNNQGKVSQTGISFGVSHIKNNFIEVDWLPGACVFHHKKNLILKDYFPFTGKAYYEDILHSKMIKEKNNRLFILRKANLFVDDPAEEISKEKLFKNKFDAFKVKKYVYKKYKISKLFYYWTTLIEILSTFKYKF